MGLESLLLSKCFWFGKRGQENVSPIPKHIDSQLGIHRPQKTLGDMLAQRLVGLNCCTCSRPI